MTADEIRKIEYSIMRDMHFVLLREICAQLAELNQRIETLSSADGKLLDIRITRTEL
jgi:hypothetical protein